MRPVFIYALNCPITGQTRYIGKTTNIQRRFRKHMQTARTRNDHRANWIRSLSVQGCVPVLEMLAQVPEGEWAQWETDYIAYFRSSGCDLVNTTDGGGGLNNPTPETRAKMRASHVGKKLPPEQREKMRAAHTGKKHTLESRAKMCGRPRWPSPETRAKIRASRLGKKASLETRAKLSAMRKGEKHPFFGKHHTPETRAKLRIAGQRQAEKQREQKLCLTTISQ